MHINQPAFKVLSKENEDHLWNISISRLPFHEYTFIELVLLYILVVNF